MYNSCNSFPLNPVKNSQRTLCSYCPWLLLITLYVAIAINRDNNCYSIANLCWEFLGESYYYNSYIAINMCAYTCCYKYYLH